MTSQDYSRLGSFLKKPIQEAMANYNIVAKKIFVDASRSIYY